MTAPQPATARLAGALRPLAIALALLALVGCGSPEEKEARHLARGIAFLEQGKNGKAMIEFRNVLRVNPKNAAAAYHIGLLHERAQRWPQAYASFRAAVAEQPDYLEAHVKLGTLALLGNDFDAAAEAAKAIERARPGHPDGLALEAAAALRRGDAQAALERAGAALDRDPDHDNAIAARAGALQRLGDAGGAVVAVDRAIARRPGHVPLRVLKVNLLEQGVGDPTAVRAAYDELVALDPGNEGYRLALAEYLQGAGGDQAGAERVLRQAADGPPGSTQAAIRLARLLRRTHGFDAAAEELRRRVEGAPDEHALRLVLAELHLSEGRHDAAEAELQAVADRAKEGPVAEDARAAVAQVALARGDHPRAKEVADRVLAGNGEHRDANVVRAAVALREGQLDDAVRHARTALRRDPAWLPALRLVAEAHLRRGEQDLAIGALNEVLARDPTDARSAQALAALLTEHGDHDAALKVWDAILERGEGKGRELALQSRARIAILRRSWAAAEADVDALLETPDGRAAGALLAGQMMAAQNRPEEAREWFRKAQAWAPDAPEPTVALVGTHLAQDDVEGASAYLRAQVERRPDDAVAFNLLGELGARRRDLAAAREGFGRAIELRPRWAAPRRQLAGALAGAGRLDEARAALEAATAAIPEDPALLGDLAALHMTAGRPLDAIRAYERVLLAEPGSELAINNLAALTADHAYGDPQALDRAMRLAERFRASGNPLLLDTLGWLLYRKGDHAAAASYLERAVGLAADRPDLRYHLGMALARTGRKERALAELRRATAAGAPAYPGIEEARATLAALEGELGASPAAAAAAGAGG